MSIRAHGGSKCAKQGINQLNQPTNYKMYIKAATRTYYSMQKKQKGQRDKNNDNKKHCDLTLDSHENTQLKYFIIVIPHTRQTESGTSEGAKAEQ